MFDEKEKKKSREGRSSEQWTWEMDIAVSFLNGCKSSKIALIYSKEKDAEVIETQSYSPENQMKNTHWLQKKMTSNP